MIESILLLIGVFFFGYFAGVTDTEEKHKKPEYNISIKDGTVG